MALTEQEELELLELEEEEARTNAQKGSQQVQSTQQPQQSQEPDILKSLLVLGGVGAGAYGAYQGGIVPAQSNAIQQRSILNELMQGKQNTVSQLQGMQSQLNLPLEGSVTNIPKQIGFMEKESKLALSSQEKQITNKFNLSLQNTKTVLDNFDKKLLNLKVSEGAKFLEEEYPKFLKSAGYGYKQGINAIEDYLVSKNIKFNSLNYQQGFIDNVITKGMSQGMLESELAPIIQIRNQISPKIDAQGFLGKETPMSFQQMRGYVSSITNANPQSKLSAIVNNEWLNFLNNNIPQEASETVKAQLSKLNNSYREFSEARFKYGNIMSKAGEFDTTKANKFLMNYFKDGMDSGQQKFMEFLTKGNDIANGISGIEEKMQAITELKPQRESITKELAVTQQLKKEALSKLSDESEKVTQRYLQMRKQYYNLKSVLDSQNEQIIARQATNIPKIIKNLWRLGRVASKAGGVIGVAPMVLDAMKFAQDPEAYFYGLETGGTGELAPKTQKSLLMPGKRETEIMTPETLKRIIEDYGISTRDIQQGRII